MLNGRKTKKQRSIDAVWGMLIAKSLSQKNQTRAMSLLEQIETTKSRFIKVTAETVDEEPDRPGSTETEWWLDLHRPIKEAPGFIGVQTYKGQDPNDFALCYEMRIIFNDQAEYYFVCKNCFYDYKDMQFTGSTKASPGWRDRAQKRLQEHESKKGWCEFCDPIFGNGGWTLEY